MMNSNESKSKLAIITLIVAVLAMAGTVSNSFFIIWKYQQERKTNITISSEILLGSKVELAGLEPSATRQDFSNVVSDIDTLFDNLIKNGYINNEGVIQDKFRKITQYPDMSLAALYNNKKEQIYTILRQIPENTRFVTVGYGSGGYYYEFKKVIKFFIKCKITNLSSKKVTIEELFWIMNHKGGSEGHSARIYDNKMQLQMLPRLLEPGEQALYFMRIEWPIDQKVIEEIKKACPGLTNFNLNPTSIEDLYTYLEGKGLDLDYESDGIAPRKFCITAITADGERFFEDCQKLFLKLKLSTPNPFVPYK